jgi:flagellar biosynthesis/type III secretory pathway chaperone
MSALPDSSVHVMATAPDHLVQAMTLAQNLEQMLEHEFEFLKGQNLEAFEAGQQAKTELLKHLAALTGVYSAQDADALGQEWDNFKALMIHCRNLHRRNEILIGRKIDALKGALQSLRIQDPASSLEVYDRLGRLNRNRLTRRYSQA